MCDLAQLQKSLRVRLAHALAVANRLVHEGLRKGGLVALVVTVLAVAVHVDDHVAPKFAAEVHRQVDDLRHRLGVLAVDVEDGDLQHLGDVAGVGGAAPISGSGSEA